MLIFEMLHQVLFILISEGFLPSFLPLLPFDALYLLYLYCFIAVQTLDYSKRYLDITGFVLV
jgi:hypothetical protein